MLSLKKVIGAAVLLLMLNQVNGQDKITLDIGDPAPPIKYSKWLKGEPITSFKGDHVYILEFWATWCVPCKKIMPHLTELQRQYKGKATIINVNVGERTTLGQPYETVLPMVEKFVKGNSDNMGFSVMVDNNDEHMAKNWFTASGSYGLPTTFIIKDEKVIWIGEPHKLDSLLPKIFDGSYKMAAKRPNGKVNKVMDKKVNEVVAKITARMKLAEEAFQAKEYEKAIQLMKENIADDPKDFYRESLFRFLLASSEKEAIAFGNEWINSEQSKLHGNRRAPMSIKDQVLINDALSKSTYLWAARLWKEYYSNDYKYSNHPSTISTDALLYAKGGDYPKAIALQQRALEMMVHYLINEEEPHYCTEDRRIEYEEALTRYKEKLIAQYKEEFAGYKKVVSKKDDVNPFGTNKRKFKLLLKLNEKDAISFGKEWYNSLQNQTPDYPQAAADDIRMILAMDDKLSKSTYLWAGSLYEEAYSKDKKSYTPMIMVKEASLYAKGGDYQKAITLQQKAVEGAKALLSKGEFTKDITKDLVIQYEDALGEYKKAGKAAKK